MHRPIVQICANTDADVVTVGFCVSGEAETFLPVDDIVSCRRNDACVLNSLDSRTSISPHR